MELSQVVEPLSLTGSSTPTCTASPPLAPSSDQLPLEPLQKRPSLYPTWGSGVGGFSPVHHVTTVLPKKT